ncbi:MAG: sulfite exporter TauE/SafE family protein [candidate division NC10 bacterium]|nr:sulfite exporter TauE/SafE family protein [candidate division NC10 bacterium]
MGIKEILELTGYGFFIGSYGTLVGIGGGFLLVPFMLLFYQATPQQAAGTSLWVVFLNASSGTWAYVRQKRIDYKSAWKFSLATIPGAILGVYLSLYFTARSFRLVFGSLLLALSLFLVFKPDTGGERGHSFRLENPHSPYVKRDILDGQGMRHVYSFDEGMAILFSSFLGFFSSILGIGGGIIQVPALVYLFSFPTHVATATSQFVLAFTTLWGALFHGLAGNVLLAKAIPMGLGAILGAQVGDWMAKRVRGPLIIRLLSLALFIVGFRLLSEAMAWYRG